MKRPIATPPTLILWALTTTLFAGCAASQPMPESPSESVSDRPESVSPPPSVPDSVDDAGGRAMSRKPSLEAAEGAPQMDMPADVAPAPAMVTRAHEDDESLFEGDTYEAGSSAREDVEELVKKIKAGTSSQQAAIADRDRRSPRSCGEICDISEAICTSSTKICRIADTQPSEPFFGDRCQWSRRECRSADERCSQCSP